MEVGQYHIIGVDIGIAQDMKKPLLEEHLLANVFFNLCLSSWYRLLNQGYTCQKYFICSEMVGAVRGIDPQTNNYFDDTKRYIDATPNLTEAEKQHIFQERLLRLSKAFKD